MSNSSQSICAKFPRDEKSILKALDGALFACDRVVGVLDLGLRIRRTQFYVGLASDRIGTIQMTGAQYDEKTNSVHVTLKHICAVGKVGIRALTLCPREVDKEVFFDVPTGSSKGLRMHCLSTWTPEPVPLAAILCRDDSDMDEIDVVWWQNPEYKPTAV
jgi:hypothetical protein